MEARRYVVCLSDDARVPRWIEFNISCLDSLEESCFMPSIDSPSRTRMVAVTLNLDEGVSEGPWCADEASREAGIDGLCLQSLAASLPRALAHSLACLSERGDKQREREPDIETHIGETLDHGVVLLLPMRVRLMIHIPAYTYTIRYSHSDTWAMRSLVVSPDDTIPEALYLVYLIASFLSMIGTSIIIGSFFFVAELRKFPASLVVFLSICDFRYEMALSTTNHTPLQMHLPMMRRSTVIHAIINTSNAIDRSIEYSINQRVCHTNSRDIYRMVGDIIAPCFFTRIFVNLSQSAIQCINPTRSSIQCNQQSNASIQPTHQSTQQSNPLSNPLDHYH